ncbi:hypothetical protein Aduo_019160 [Ancylostoma duodenale]
MLSKRRRSFAFVSRTRRTGSNFGRRLYFERRKFVRENSEDLSAKIEEEMKKLHELVELADALKKILHQDRVQGDFKANVAKVLYDLTGLIDVKIFRVKVLVQVSLH